MAPPFARMRCPLLWVKCVCSQDGAAHLASHLASHLARSLALWQALVRSLEAERSKVKQEAWALAEGKMEEMEKAHAEAYRVLTKRIQFLQE
eukprot:2838-Rhodomonas_salina.1